VWIDAGARNETTANNGVAHLLERLAFKVMIFIFISLLSYAHWFNEILDCLRVFSA